MGCFVIWKYESYVQKARGKYIMLKIHIRKNNTVYTKILHTFLALCAGELNKCCIEKSKFWFNVIKGICDVCSTWSIFEAHVRHYDWSRLTMNCLHVAWALIFSTLTLHWGISRHISLQTSHQSIKNIQTTAQTCREPAASSAPPCLTSESGNTRTKMD